MGEAWEFTVGFFGALGEGFASVAWEDVHIFWKAQIYLLASGFSLLPVAFLWDNLHTNRVGGLLFWRLGRLGGSFYIARRNPNTEA